MGEQLTALYPGAPKRQKNIAEGHEETKSYTLIKYHRIKIYLKPAALL